jgi:hypothetical protein
MLPPLGVEHPQKRREVPRLYASTSGSSIHEQQPWKLSVMECLRLRATRFRHRKSRPWPVGEIKNVASGLYGSFISRNNDVAGYWGIGKLCLLVQNRKTTTVQLDLLARTITPESPETTKLLAGYRLLLQEHLSAQGIPIRWVVSQTLNSTSTPRIARSSTSKS